jgi:hypothetical protein
VKYLLKIGNISVECVDIICINAFSNDATEGEGTVPPKHPLQRKFKARVPGSHSEFEMLPPESGLYALRLP